MLQTCCELVVWLVHLLLSSICGYFAHVMFKCVALLSVSNILDELCLTSPMQVFCLSSRGRLLSQSALMKWLKLKLKLLSYTLWWKTRTLVELVHNLLLFTGLKGKRIQVYQGQDQGLDKLNRHVLWLGWISPAPGQAQGLDHSWSKPWQFQYWITISVFDLFLILRFWIFDSHVYLNYDYLIDRIIDWFISFPSCLTICFAGLNTDQNQLGYFLK